jgi:hypothetical protein
MNWVEKKCGKSYGLIFESLNDNSTFCFEICFDFIINSKKSLALCSDSRSKSSIWRQIEVESDIILESFGRMVSWKKEFRNKDYPSFIFRYKGWSRSSLENTAYFSP